MNTRQRFLSVLNFEKPEGRLPMLEWAPWWDKTYCRWQNEGLPTTLTGDDLYDYFNLDRLEILYVQPIGAGCPRPTHHGASIIKNEADYQSIKKYLFTDKNLQNAITNAKRMKESHERGDFALRVWLDGCFWFPRSLFGIEAHMYAFYDYTELMHQMNDDLLRFNLRTLEAVFDILTPDMVGIGEDMSYNHGPMLSKEMYDAFIAPYYARYMPLIKERGIKILVDTDGDVTQMLPWLVQSQIDGIYPLERQAGVDIAQIRKEYPQLIILGAYDKLVMSKGESAMRAEFERLLPVMRSGGFIPSVDHQTPPEVSLENYRVYRRLFEEYCVKAVK